MDITPLKDDPALGVDPLRNNNFTYDIGDDPTAQDRCPFAAHTRKTNPRFDLEGPFGPNATTPKRIIRRGIQFGPEVTDREEDSNQTFYGRGLLFAAYQSNIPQGFQFIQQSKEIFPNTSQSLANSPLGWADNSHFPPKKPIAAPGIDPIIGQISPVNQNNPPSRSLVGTDPNDQAHSLELPINWVVPKGGEYFFSPSISALKSTLAL